MKEWCFLTSLRSVEKKGVCAVVRTMQVACWKNPGRQRAIEHGAGALFYSSTDTNVSSESRNAALMLSENSVHI